MVVKKFYITFSEHAMLKDSFQTSVGLLVIITEDVRGFRQHLKLILGLRLKMANTTFLEASAHV